MNKRDAIRLCKKKYRAMLKNNAKDLSLIPDNLRNELLLMDHYCPLCQYVHDQTGRTPYTDVKGSCNVCPLVVQYGRICTQLHYNRWWQTFATRYIFPLKGDR